MHGQRNIAKKLHLLLDSYWDEKQVLPVDNKKWRHKIVFCSINVNNKRAYNLTLRFVRVTNVAMKKYYMFWVRVFSLIYLAFKVVAPF